MSLRSLLITCIALLAGLMLSCKDDDPATADAAGPGGDGPGGKDQSSFQDLGPSTDGPVPTGAAKKTLEALALLEQGKPADLDGDGTPEATLTKGAGGAITLEIDENGDKVPDFVMKSTPNTSSSISVDNDLDGVVDWKSAATAGPPVVRVIDEDLDFNDKLDRRTTLTFDLKAQTVRIVVEDDSDEDGTYTQVSDDTISSNFEAGAGGCDGHSGFPSYTKGPTRAVGPIKVPYGGGGGRCSQAQADRLAGAIQGALGKGLNCLAQRNPELKNKLFAALLRSELIVGCGNTCAGQYANYNTSWFGKPHLNTNPGMTSKLSDKQLGTIMLHELLHWAGEGMGKDHNKGEDQTYSCGRYCGGCNAIGPGASQGSNVDCAKCAKTPADKAACGVQDKLVETTGSYALCHKSFSNAQCEKYMGWQKQACDGTPLSKDAVTFSCCICAAQYTKNDTPCSGPDTVPGSCANPPPDC